MPWIRFSRSGLVRTCAAFLCTAWLAGGPGLASGQTPRDNVVELLSAAAFPVRSTGGTYGTLDPKRDWNLWSNGYLETTTAVPHDAPATQTSGSPHTLSITAYGSVAGGVWPAMAVLVDGTVVQRLSINSATPRTYAFTVPLRAGLRRVRLQFTNDAIVNGADRNLYLRELKIGIPDIAATLPTGAGTFPVQSISMLSGFFSSNAQDYGLNTPCSPSLHPGCANIDAIRAMGGNNVTLVSSCQIKAGTSGCVPQIHWNNEEQGLRVAIRYARSRGLGVTLKPFVLAPDGQVLQSAGWVPANPEEFFSSVEANLKRHARIAREEGASLLMIGAEMGGAITAAQTMNNQCTRWRQLITRVRAEAASVARVPAGSPAVLPLTYSPTLAGFWNNLAANEAPYVCFWDELDYIGVNAYPHLNLATAQDAVANRITSGWQVYRRLLDSGIVIGQTAGFDFSMPLAGYTAFDLRRTDAGSYQARYGTNRYSTKWYVDFVIDEINRRFQTSLTARGKYPLKAMLTEVGAPSNPNVQGYWGAVHDGAGYNPATWPLYVDEQARAWDGYLRAFRADPRIVGISQWGLRPYHARDWLSTPVDILIDYDFNAKANAAGAYVTEEAVCRWFKRTPPATGPCYR